MVEWIHVFNKQRHMIKFCNTLLNRKLICFQIPMEVGYWNQWDCMCTDRPTCLRAAGLDYKHEHISWAVEYSYLPLWHTLSIFFYFRWETKGTEAMWPLQNFTGSIADLQLDSVYVYSSHIVDKKGFMDNKLIFILNRVTFRYASWNRPFPLNRQPCKQAPSGVHREGLPIQTSDTDGDQRWQAPGLPRNKKTTLTCSSACSLTTQLLHEKKLHQTPHIHAVLLSPSIIPAALLCSLNLLLPSPIQLSDYLLPF